MGGGGFCASLLGGPGCLQSATHACLVCAARPWEGEGRSGALEPSGSSTPFRIQLPPGRPQAALSSWEVSYQFRREGTLGRPLGSGPRCAGEGMEAHGSREAMWPWACQSEKGQRTSSWVLNSISSL